MEGLFVDLWMGSGSAFRLQSHRMFCIISLSTLLWFIFLCTCTRQYSIGTIHSGALECLFQEKNLLWAQLTATLVGANVT